jgi:addiction module RelE/StbE family toxin
MDFKLATDFKKNLEKIKKKDPRLLLKIQKQLALFKDNHNHPSLRNHKLKGNLSRTWSISITKGIRMLYYISEGYAVFFSIGTHEQVYR